jgi:hypothetical protein
MNKHLIAKAKEMLRENKDYYEDAMRGAPVGNTVIGSVLSIVFGAPRWATEDAVVEALRQMRREGRAAAP